MLNVLLFLDTISALPLSRPLVRRYRVVSRILSDGESLTSVPGVYTQGPHALRGGE
jgi:hypothetical protein